MPDREPRRIYPITEADLSEILALERSAFSSPWTKDAFLQELAREDAHCLLLRRKSGDPSAYICFRVFMGEMHILRIATAPGLRQRGFAGLLLHRSIGIARDLGATAGFLETFSGNRPALGLYEAAGFSVAGTRKAYYPAEQPGGLRRDAVTLVKNPLHPREP